MRGGREIFMEKGREREGRIISEIMSRYGEWKEKGDKTKKLRNKNDGGEYY